MRLLPDLTGKKIAVVGARNGATDQAVQSLQASGAQAEYIPTTPPLERAHVHGVLSAILESGADAVFIDRPQLKQQQAFDSIARLVRSLPEKMSIVVRDSCEPYSLEFSKLRGQGVKCLGTASTPPEEVALAICGAMAAKGSVRHR